MSLSVCLHALFNKLHSESADDRAANKPLSWLILLDTRTSLDLMLRTQVSWIKHFHLFSSQEDTFPISILIPTICEPPQLPPFGPHSPAICISGTRHCHCSSPAIRRSAARGSCSLLFTGCRTRDEHCPSKPFKIEN